MMPSAFQRNLWIRLPALLMVMAIGALFIAWPYRGLNSDAAIFGIMGHDLLQVHYWPTLMYGQKYLISITPYLYGLTGWLTRNALSPALTLAIAGGILSLTGLWLIYESFITIQRLHGRPVMIPAICFCLWIVASPVYVFDIGVNASMEVSLWALGLIMASASRVERAAMAGGISRAGWVLLGLALAYAYISRPQSMLFGLPMLPWLFWRQWRASRRREFLFAIGLLAVGVLVGGLPMILHQGFRAAAWPYACQINMTPAGSFHEMNLSIGRLVKIILPAVFGLSREHPVYSLLVLLWMAGAVGGLAVTAVRRRSWLSALDAGWILGAGAMAGIMSLTPALTLDAQCRRYCLNGFLVVGWLFCRFCLGPGRRSLPAMALVALLLLSAIPLWQQRLPMETAQDRALRDAEKELIPELIKLDSVILSDYWSAYLLLFLSDGKLRIEAFPWELIRTQGRLREEDVRRKTLWLVRYGRGHYLVDCLREYQGQATVDSIVSLPLPLSLTYLGRPCECWTVGNRSTAVELIRRFCPPYFSTPYPPTAR